MEKKNPFLGVRKHFDEIQTPQRLSETYTDGTKENCMPFGKNKNEHRS